MLFNKYDPQFKQPDGSYLLAQTARTALVQVGVASKTLQDPQQAPAAAGGSTSSIYSADGRMRASRHLPPRPRGRLPSSGWSPRSSCCQRQRQLFNSPDKRGLYAQPLNRQLKLVGLGPSTTPIRTSRCSRYAKAK